jgi:decaprenylphospho-beta-D-ribofuranose 2-oxidase
MAELTGFGLASRADAYYVRPATVGQVQDALQLARQSGRKVVLRGAGRSYGDAAIATEALAIDLTRMDRILSWDPESGLIDVEPGVTIEGLWRHTLEDGFWPPVVSGTMFPTVGGALAMNIHGKNNFREGVLGEHVAELDVVWTNGQLETLTPEDERFFTLIGGLGLFGVIVRARIRMKKVPSSQVRVLPVACRLWNDQFRAFEDHEADADYMVSWIDAFGRGKSAGRGLFHAAWYAESSQPKGWLPSSQDLPDTILGYIPKGQVWRYLRWFNNRSGMRLINRAKATSAWLGHGKPLYEGLVGFSFLLDYVPNWRRAYRDGFIQFQSFIPKQFAPDVFREQVRMQQAEKLESYLAVMKRHRPDPFLLTHGVDGYSLALDFKVDPRTWPRLQRLCHRMAELVLESGGKFYPAKDSILSADLYQRSIGLDTVQWVRSMRGELDPEGLLTSGFAQRVGL